MTTAPWTYRTKLIQGPPGPKGPTGGSANVLYVATSGSDTTGNGSFSLPFATYGKCVAAIGGAATVSSSWTIQFAPGRYTEAMVLAPWIFIAGDTGQTTQFFESMTLSSSFLNGSAETGGGIAFVEFEYSATVDFNFASIHAVNAYLSFNYVTFPTTFSVEGNGYLGSAIFFESCGIENNVTLSNISVTSLYTNWAVGLTLSAISSAVNWNSDGDTIDGNTLFNGNAGQAVSAILNGTSVVGGLTLNGTLATYQATISGVPGAGVTLTGSASISQYTIIGELPPQNVQPAGTDGWVLTTSGGVSVWAAPPGVILGTTPWTPGSIASGAAVSQSVTVTGALVGQVAMGAFSLSLPAGVFCVGVAGAGVVEVTMVNLSVSSQMIAAGTVTGAALLAT